MRFWAVVLATALIAATFALGGCGAIAKKAVESATGVSVDESGDSVTIKGNDGTEVNVNSSEGQLAADFPDSVPVYDGTITDSAGMTANGASTWTASLTTPDSIDDVKDFYVQRLQAEGWKTTFDMDSSDGSGARTVAYSAELDDLSLTVTIAAPDGTTEIAILVGTKAK